MESCKGVGVHPWDHRTLGLAVWGMQCLRCPTQFTKYPAGAAWCGEMPLALQTGCNLGSEVSVNLPFAGGLYHPVDCQHTAEVHTERGHPAVWDIHPGGRV